MVLLLRVVTLASRAADPKARSVEQEEERGRTSRTMFIPWEVYCQVKFRLLGQTAFRPGNYLSVREKRHYAHLPRR